MLYSSLRLFLFFVFIQSENVWAIRCDLAEKLSDSKIISNHEFWEEFNQLSHQGKIKDHDLEKILIKHGIQSETVTKNAAASALPERPFSYTTTSKADKDIKKLPASLRAQYEEFAELISKGELKALYENPGRWHLEKMKGYESRYSIRLNVHVRVTFEKKKNGIEILQANADAYPH